MKKLPIVFELEQDGYSKEEIEEFIRDLPSNDDVKRCIRKKIRQSLIDTIFNNMDILNEGMSKEAFTDLCKVLIEDLKQRVEI